MNWWRLTKNNNDNEGHLEDQRARVQGVYQVVGGRHENDDEPTEGIVEIVTVALVHVFAHTWQVGKRTSALIDVIYIVLF